MKLGKIGVISAAILLAGGVSLATAAESGMSKSSSSAGMTNSASQGKCWNAATNTVQDKATQGASGTRKPGGLTTGSGTAGNAANSSGSKLQTRPAGVPNC